MVPTSKGVCAARVHFLLLPTQPLLLSARVVPTQLCLAPVLLILSLPKRRSIRLIAKHAPLLAAYSKFLNARLLADGKIPLSTLHTKLTHPPLQYNHSLCITHPKLRHLSIQQLRAYRRRRRCQFRKGYARRRI